MAEAFANRYGSDVLEAASAGLYPIPAIDPRTVEVMEELGIDVSLHEPSEWDPIRATGFDLIVNLSGAPLRGTPVETIDWKVKDPYRAKIEVYREVRDEIERRVMLLILDLRRESLRAAG